MFNGIKFFETLFELTHRNLQTDPDFCVQENHFKDLQGYCKQCHEIIPWAGPECCSNLICNADPTNCCFVPYDDKYTFKPTIVNFTTA